MSIENLATYFGISVVFGVIKARLNGTTNAVAWIFSMFVSIAVGVALGYFFEAINLPPGVVFALVGAVVLVAENIVKGIMGLGPSIEKDPIEILNKLRRGK